MILAVVSIIMTAVGDIMIGIAVLRVHIVLSKEGRVDEEVIQEVRDEQRLIFVAIILILLGLLLNIVYLTSQT